MTLRRTFRGRFFGLCLLGAACAACAAPGAAGESILDGGSFWRQHFTWRTPIASAGDGKVVSAPARFRAGKCACTKDGLTVETPPPAADWMSVEFDDGAWSRLPADATADWPVGWICGGGPSGREPGYLAVLCMRGKFKASGAAALKLSLGYRGGVVVYLNGEEVARGHLPEGEIGPATPAEAYPESAFGRRKPGRVRTLQVALPGRLVRKGVNVLAVELHRAPIKLKGREDRWGNGWWTAGIADVRLTAGGGGVEPNVARPRGLQVWNGDMAAEVRDADHGDPCEPLRPIRIVAARNGAFSGKIVLGADAPLQGLQATVTDLSLAGGEGTIPAAQVLVRYPRLGDPDELAGVCHPAASGVRRFDALFKEPPATVPVAKKELRKRGREAGLTPPVPGAVQPVWITVQVPKDAAPGKYTGKLSVRAGGHPSPRLRRPPSEASAKEGGRTVEVPVELEVFGWTLPDPKESFVCANFYQSPHGVAEEFKAPRWSGRHFELIRRSFELTGAAGNKTVFVPLICKTNQGHAESMVRWIRKGGGWEHDYTLMEKYLDVAAKTMGKPMAVVFIVWEVYGPGSCPGKGLKGKGMGPLVSVLDPATKKISEVEGPKYGTPESEAFWRPVLTEIRARMKKRGWEDVMMLGQGADLDIDANALGVFAKILPDCKWMRSSHHPTNRTSGGRGKDIDGVKTPQGVVPVTYQENAYVHGAAVNLIIPHEPACRRVHAHTGPDWAVFPRANTAWLIDSSTLAKHRFICENFIATGRRGVARLGADFWFLLKASRNRTGRLPCRYPDSSHGGAMNMSYAAILAAGPDAPVATTRLEALREGVQECEARVFIERALAGKRVSGDLARRAQEALDERTRLIRVMHMNLRGALLWLPGSGWQARSRELYAVAARVAAATGTR